MGYGLDEEWDEYDIGNDVLQHRFERNVWTCRDGTTLSLYAMTPKHLNNAIKHIERSGDDSVFGFGGQWLDKLYTELRSRN